MQDPSAPRPHSPAELYLSALRDLDSPPAVVGLAATLTTQAEDIADAENIRFLRSIDPQEEWRSENAAAAEQELLDEVRSARERLQARERAQARTSELRNEDRERQMRLSRILNTLSRINDPPNADSMAYSDRTPRQNNLYDWSPAHEEGDDEEELEEVLQELRHQQPNTHPEILRVLGRSQLDVEQQTRNWANSRRTHIHEAAQSPSSARRHPRFSARSRDYMQRYIMDREAAYRGQHGGGEVDRHTSSRLPAASTSTSASRYEAGRRAWQSQQRAAGATGANVTLDRDVRARIDAYRRGYLENPSSSSPSATPTWLEETIKYLSRLRSSNYYEDSLSLAVDAGFVSKEFFGEGHEDFVLETRSLPSPPYTSWLAPGVVFSGSQRATSVNASVTRAPSPATSTTLYRFRNNETMTSTTFDPARSNFDPARPWLSHTYTPPHLRRTADATSTSSQQDRWPVRVTIHAVDYSAMTLAATMEAYNVPSHTPSYTSIISSANATTSTSSAPTSTTQHPTNDPAARPASTPTRSSSITTYLEGELLDFNTHTFQTESFASSPATDATYWRKLPPFAKISDDDLVHRLVSRTFLAELQRDWILMRWKERCFVRKAAGQQQRSDRHLGWGGAGDQEALSEDGCGLTISGFYYVCLRRADGEVEGLYYDPQSSPYQHLQLSSAGTGTFPAWSFR
ncbi:hypothetical protein W97_02654 [Coniosporium apollinis CBS 100218]|uniref:Vacuolar import and degradation protein-domain-containing protein n=1 Tax=Coniosporium apollinis (strain CBS 100218) TaxID=1168221 RepID=R7YNF1_CONA1|nr:uncharacterized protein W97_02654 [Coniosporium apollinis CBS 100218]EON63427.1 hypothetical protein W97_02654 [Coniosporium apollinis CBS 100218]